MTLNRLSFLQFIDPEYVLSRLPRGSLLELQALMLERLGHHDDCLKLFVYGLGDIQLAEAYCDRQYEAAVAAEATGGPGRLD